MNDIEHFFATLSLKHALTGNGAVLAVSMLSVESTLKIALLAASLALTLLTIYFKCKHNGKDK